MPNFKKSTGYKMKGFSGFDFKGKGKFNFGKTADYSQKAIDHSKYSDLEKYDDDRDEPPFKAKKSSKKSPKAVGSKKDKNLPTFRKGTVTIPQYDKSGEKRYNIEEK